MKGDIPHPSIRRLSIYLRQLEALAEREARTVSSQKLAESLNLTGAQVRKDLAYFGQFGRSGIGYEVAPLAARLRRILGTDRVSNALLVGVGNIGRALASYQGFRPKGFELVAVLDSDRSKLGMKIGALTVSPMDELEQIVIAHHVRLGIVTVPAEAAQFIAERLVAAGIRGILNFAPVQLSVPPEITVRNIDVAGELEQLNFLAGD